MQNKLMMLMFENRTLVLDNQDILVERAEEFIRDCYMQTGDKKIFVTVGELYRNEKDAVSSVAIRDNLDVIRDGLEKHGYNVRIEEKWSDIDGYYNCIAVSV